MKRQGRTNVNVSDVKDAKKLLRLTRLAREIRLMDQILSDDLDEVEVLNSGPAPAWTSHDGEKITFNNATMPEPRRVRDIAVWLGTNAHELGHVLFSPRSDSILIRRIQEGERTGFLKGIAMLANILEDQRQERLVLARFAPWRPYLTAALGHHLSATGDHSWLLMAGRTWLPDGVRSLAKANSVKAFGQQMTDRITAIVGDYQALTDPGFIDSDEAWSLLQDLHSLLDLRQPPPQHVCTTIDGGEPDTSEPDDSVPPTASEKDAEDEANADDSSDDDSGDSGESGDDSGKSDSGSDEDSESESESGDSDSGESGESGEQDSAGDGGSASGSSQDDSQGDSQSQSQSDTQTPSNGKGSSGGLDKPLPPNVLKELMKEALKQGASEQLGEDEDSVAEIESIMEALDHGRAGSDIESDWSAGQWVNADDAARRLHYEVSEALLDLKDESEPGWFKRTDSGRLNARRLLYEGANPEEMFDRYEPGQMDSTELELVVVLDVSSSMDAQESALGRATWAIRRAMDDLEGEITVVTFNNGPATVIAGTHDRPDERMFIPMATGGTDPREALKVAYQKLADSQSRNRICLILTDGQWSYDSGNAIAAMNAAGIVTAIALLGDYAGDDLHGCNIGAHIDDSTELATLFRRIALEQMRSFR